MTPVTEYSFALAYSQEPRGIRVVEGESQDEGHEFWNDLESIGRPRVYKPGAFLFEQGAEATGIYLIRRGNVRVFVSSRTHQKTLTEATPGTVLGLSECFSEGKHKVAAEALGCVELLFVDRRRLMLHLRGHPKACMEIVRALSEDLQCLYHMFRVARSRHDKQRVESDNGDPGSKAG